MPFTPLHLGPALLLGMIFFRYVDLLTFLISSIIVDIEPFLVLTLNFEYPFHGFVHSFLGATIMALLLAAVMGKVREHLTSVLEFFKLEQKPSIWSILLASFLGAYLHVLLDSPLYPEMRPFYPLDINPLLGRSPLTSFEIYSLCIVCFIGGLAVYGIKIVRKK